MRFLRHVSRFTGDEWVLCNGYAIGKKVRAKDASATTERLAHEYV